MSVLRMEVEEVEEEEEEGGGNQDFQMLRTRRTSMLRWDQDEKFFSRDKNESKTIFFISTSVLLLRSSSLHHKNSLFPLQINFEAKRHGRKGGARMNSVESPSASLCSDGNSPTLTPPSSMTTPSSSMITPPSSSSSTNPTRPLPHSLWSKSVEGSESECLIWSWCSSPYPHLRYQPAIPCSEIFSDDRNVFANIFDLHI